MFASAWQLSQNLVWGVSWAGRVLACPRRSLGLAVDPRNRARVFYLIYLLKYIRRIVKKRRGREGKLKSTRAGTKRVGADPKIETIERRARKPPPRAPTERMWVARHPMGESRTRTREAFELGFFDWVTNRLLCHQAPLKSSYYEAILGLPHQKFIVRPWCHNFLVYFPCLILVRHYVELGGLI